MLKNNIEVDVKVKCIEAETTQAKLAEDVGILGVRHRTDLCEA